MYYLLIFISFFQVSLLLFIVSYYYCYCYYYCYLLLLLLLFYYCFDFMILRLNSIVCCVQRGFKDNDLAR